MWRIALLVLSLAPPLVAQTTAVEGIAVPMRVHGGRMAVTVDGPDGDRFDFIVSTNAVTVLSESGAARIGRRRLTLGGVPVVTDHAETFSDEDLTVGGELFDGMIGSNTLNGFDVLFDAPGSRLVLKQVGRSVEWEGMTMSEPVPIRIFHGVVISLEVEVNGTSYPAMMEIGTPSVIVNEAIRTGAGIAGDRIDSFRIGNTAYPDVPVQVEDLAVFRRFSPDGGGVALVGAPVAIDCAISVSYVHQELRTCVR